MLYTSKAFAPLARGSLQQRRTFINWMTNYPDKVRLRSEGQNAVIIDIAIYRIDNCNFELSL
jgi:hypothetical protein